MARLIHKLGGKPYVVPTVEIKPQRNERLITQLYNRILTERIEFLIFMSVNGVTSLMKNLEKLGLKAAFLQRLHKTTIIAVGPKTRRELENQGVKVNLVPKRYSSQGIVESLKKMDLGQKTVVIPRSDKSSGYLTRELERLGAEVHEAPIYKSTLPSDHSEVLGFVDDLKKGEIDVVTFTSSSTALNLFKIASEHLVADDLRSCLRKTVITAIGPVTRRTLEELGVKVDVVPGEYTIEAMVGALADQVGDISGGAEQHFCPPEKMPPENFLPRLISWNLTFKCNLRCAHCYVDADKSEGKGELNTDEGRMLIDQIVEVGKPILIMSGGEPLLRDDVFELARYGTDKGLRVAMGTNGTLITDQVANQLKSSGVRRIAISLDSAVPQRHDEFRGVKGSWRLAVEGVKACRRNDLDVQINTTLTKQNYHEIDHIVDLAEKVGASDLHIFFLVPTGRGKKVEDVSPAMYERMIRSVLEKSTKSRLNIKPTCAPQFMRILKQMDIRPKKHWSRGCIAGLSYCRVYPTGQITPCPYLPIKLGNIREKRLKDIWFGSKILRTLRDFNNLKGKCRICEYRNICGGCRARAYGVTSNLIDVCSGLHEPTRLIGDYLAEDPWCTYKPKGLGGEKV